MVLFNSNINLNNNCNAERLQRGGYSQGGLVDMLYREAKVEAVEYGETIQVTAVCTPKVLGQVEEFVWND